MSSSALTLYEVSENLVALLDSYDLCQSDEARMECEAEIRQTIDTQLRKVDNFCRFLSHLESQTELAEKEIKRLKAREAVFANLQERLERYAVLTMQSLNLRKLEGDTTTLTLRPNQPAVEVDDETAVPGKFKTIIETVKIDKMAVKAALKSGETVPGAHLREPTVSLLRK